jgi:hypothetical protein
MFKKFGLNRNSLVRIFYLKQIREGMQWGTLFPRAKGGKQPQKWRSKH